jgi:hypothetical protein
MVYVFIGDFERSSRRLVSGAPGANRGFQHDSTPIDEIGGLIGEINLDSLLGQRTGKEQ